MVDSAASVLEIAGERETKGLAYEHSGQSVVDASDILIAVWDGKESAGRGGTTDLLPVTSAVLIGVAAVFGSAMLLTWRTAPKVRANVSNSELVTGR